MEPISWTTRAVDMPACGHYLEDETAGTGDNVHFVTDVVKCPDVLTHPMRPAVLFGCTTGVCARTEVIKPRKRSRTVPEGITEYQFQALKSGTYWNEISQGA
jgi:hypothetical protein